MSKEKTKPSTSKPVDFNLENIINSLPEMELNNKYGSGLRNTSNTTNTTNTVANLSPQYVEITKAELLTCPANTYIRYTDLEGNLKLGASLKQIATSVDGKEQIVKFGKFNSQTRKYISWSVSISKIGKVFKFVPDDVKKNTTGGANNVGNTVGKYTIQYDEPTPHSSNAVPHTTENTLIDQIGEHLLFDNSNEVLKNKIEALELTVQQMSIDIKKICKVLARVVQQS